MATKDPYMIDKSETKKMREETTGRGTGVICPKRNKSINKQCKVCDTVAQLFSDNSKDKREIAIKKMAKLNWYCNIVLPSNPSKVLIFEMGKKAGNQILEGIEMKDWTDIAHPKKGMGRTMLINKSKSDDFNTYSVSPSLKNADWDVPEDVLKNLPDLDEQIFDMIKNRDDRIFRVSELKVGETFEFRILPPWGIENGNRNILKPVWRHWGGVTEAEVNGTVDVNIHTSDEAVAEATTTTVTDEPVKQSKTESTETGEKKPGCFGEDRFFDMDDPDCQKCDWLKKCAKIVKA